MALANKTCPATPALPRRPQQHSRANAPVPKAAAPPAGQRALPRARPPSPRVRTSARCLPAATPSRRTMGTQGSKSRQISTRPVTSPAASTASSALSARHCARGGVRAVWRGRVASSVACSGKQCGKQWQPVASSGKQRCEPLRVRARWEWEGSSGAGGRAAQRRRAVQHRPPPHRERLGVVQVQGLDQQYGRCACSAPPPSHRERLRVVQVQGLRDLAPRAPYKQRVPVDGGHQGACEGEAHARVMAPHCCAGHFAHGLGGCAGGGGAARCMRVRCLFLLLLAPLRLPCGT